MVIRAAVIAAAAMALACLTSCGGQSGGHIRSSSMPRQAAKASAPKAHDHRHHRKTAVHHRRHRRATGFHGLVAIHDPGEVTGTLTGPCQTRNRGLLPDPSCTPGAIDPAVTQANIGSTICRAGYTDSVRPPESRTEAFKWDHAEPAYGQHDVSGELDHLVPLELGGDNDARNLWVEAGPIPNAKDAVENALNHAVCDGQITLRAAQRDIARNWINAAAALGIGVPRPGSSPSASSSAWCTAAASYSSRYADWDVYVQSNQPDATVTASSGGYSHSWHTNSDGYADVYLRGPSRGQTITVTVGAASCTTTAG
jgi:5-methylcytosine-specific restriction endonuclease McrA